MSQVLALTERELRSYFLSPLGYVIIACFLLMAGIIFMVQSFGQGQLASLRPVFNLGTWVLLFVCPAITMRSIAEERRLGTFELLMSCPISETQVIVSKFLAVLGFLAAMFVPLIVLAVSLELYGRPDYGEFACGLFGMILVGAAYLSSGLLASTLTSSQVAAFLMTLFFWIVLSIGAKFLPHYLPELWMSLAFAADPDPRLRDFAIGLFDTSNVIYFLSLTAMFLTAAIYSLHVTRWR